MATSSSSASKRDSRETTASIGSGISRGLSWCVPVALGYLPVGLAYGVLARASGLSFLETVLMSAMVYAGSAQFAAIDLIAAGAGLSSLVAAAGLINLRHILMSASLCRRFERIGTLAAAALAFGVTDETFAVAGLKSEALDPAEGLTHSTIALNVSAYACWVASSAAGACLGDAALNFMGEALGFALPAMFIALLSFGVRDSVSALVAAVAGGTSLFLALAFPGKWNAIAATFVGATAGTLVRFRGRPRAG